MNKLQLFDANEARLATITPQVIRDLASYVQGIDVAVGARVTTTSNAVTCMKFLDPASKGFLIVPDGKLGPAKGDHSPFRTVRAVDSDEGVYQTRRTLERAHRQGEGTCLIVNSLTPIPNIIRQLHMSHEYVLVAWEPDHAKQFTLGLVKTAWENASTVIADQVRGATQAREVLMQGVSLGIVQRDSALRRSS